MGVHIKRGMSKMSWLVPTIDGKFGVSSECFDYLRQWLSDGEAQQLVWSLSPHRRIHLVSHLEEQAMTGHCYYCGRIHDGRIECLIGKRFRMGIV